MEEWRYSKILGITNCEVMMDCGTFIQQRSVKIRWCFKRRKVPHARSPCSDERKTALERLEIPVKSLNSLLHANLPRRTRLVEKGTGMAMQSVPRCSNMTLLRRRCMKEEEISRSRNERNVISSPSRSNLVLPTASPQAASHVGGSERLFGAWGALRSLQFDEPFCWPTMISRISVSPSKMREMLDDNVWLTGVVRH
jgi:hypothetical protein